MLKKIVIGVVVVAILVGGVLFGGPIFSRVMLMFNPPSQLVSSPSHEFTVNLNDPSMRRILRVSMTFKYYASRELVAELNEKDAQVRHTVISILRTRSTADFNADVGNDLLRADLVAGLNAILETGDIETIYFTDFVIQ